jgi:hypothetical protein
MQMALFFIFAADLAAFVVLFVASELGYGFSSTEEEHNTACRRRMPHQARHRSRTPRRRMRCRSKGYPHER